MTQNTTIISNLDAIVFGGREFMDDIKKFVEMCEEDLVEESTLNGGISMKIPILGPDDMLSVMLSLVPKIRNEGRAHVQMWLTNWLNQEVFADDHTHTCSEAIAAAGTALLVEMVDTMERAGHDVYGPYFYDLIKRTYSGTVVVSRMRTDC